jgi:hypothetical protein
MLMTARCTLIGDGLSARVDSLVTGPLAGHVQRRLHPL